MKKLRSATVEPVIGTLVGYLGMKRVNTRGLELANKCMLMAAVAYNLRKLLKHQSYTRVSMVNALETAVKRGFSALVFALLRLPVPNVWLLTSNHSCKRGQ